MYIKFRNLKSHFLPPLLINTVLKVLATAIKREKNKPRMDAKVGKYEMKYYLQRIMIT